MYLSRGPRCVLHFTTSLTVVCLLPHTSAHVRSVPSVHMTRLPKTDYHHPHFTDRQTDRLRPVPAFNCKPSTPSPRSQLLCHPAPLAGSPVLIESVTSSYFIKGTGGEKWFNFLTEFFRLFPEKLTYFVDCSCTNAVRTDWNIAMVFLATAKAVMKSAGSDGSCSLS